MPRPAKPARQTRHARRARMKRSSVDRLIAQRGLPVRSGSTRACRDCRAGFAGRGMQPARATEGPTLAPAPIRDAVADRRGFTFIELIVVLAIIGLAAAVAVPAIEGGLDTREVNRAARQLRAMMHFLSVE